MTLSSRVEGSPWYGSVQALPEAGNCPTAVFFPCSRDVCTACHRESPFSDLASHHTRPNIMNLLKCALLRNILWYKPWAVLKPAPDLAPLPLQGTCVLTLPTSLGLHRVNLLWRKMALLRKFQDAALITRIGCRYWKKNCYPGQAEKLDPFQVIYTVLYSVHQPYIWNA